MCGRGCQAVPMTCFLPSQTPPDLATAAARLQTLVQMYDAAVKDAEQLEEVRGG